MNAFKFLCLILVLVCSVSNTFGTCPFEHYKDVVTACTGENSLGIVYPAGTSNTEVTSFPLRLNDRKNGYTHGIGCLDETPSPAWFAMKIDQSGDLLMKISHSKGADIDFACWGPFWGESKQAMLENVCANFDTYFVDCKVPSSVNDCRQSQLEQCESRFAVVPGDSEIEKLNKRAKMSECKMEVDRRSQTEPEYECFYGKYNAFPIDYMTDCSFSGSQTESCFIGGAKKGEWYIILVTNFGKVAGNIEFTKINGDATTDCSVIVDAGSNSPVCEGEELKLYVQNPPAYSTCKWTGPNGFEAEGANPVINAAGVSAKGTYYVQITTHDGLISEKTPVNVDVISNTPIDTVVRVVATTVVDFKGTELSKEGTYQIFENNGQCSREYNVTVEEVPLLPAFIEQNGPVCEGVSLLLSIGDAPSNFDGVEWSGPNGFRSSSENPIVRFMNSNKSGKYSLKIKKDGLLFPVAPVDVKVIPKVVEKIYQKIEYGQTYEFDGETLSKRGKYTATFESEYGCDSTVELYLLVDMPDLVPDEFITPNGDGENDVWNIKNINLCPEAVIRLYDRYGKKVYEASNYSPENAWSGKDQSGRDLPSSDYWYTIDVQSADKVYYGHVTLMR